MRSWDDLQLVLAIVEGKGLSGAASKLGVHHATVLRRLDTFEHQMGVILFERRATGYVATEIGEGLAEQAQQIALNVDETYRKLAGEDLRISGTIRVATSDYLAQRILPKVLQNFSTDYPDIAVELIVSSSLASLSRRDADVAFRLTDKKPATLVGEQLTTVSFGIYGHKSFAKKTTPMVGDLPWIADDYSMSESAISLWRERAYGDSKISLRVDSNMTKYHALQQSLGIGIIPTELGDSNKDLVQLETRPEWTLEMWFLAHADLYRMRRIQALQHCAEKGIESVFQG